MNKEDFEKITNNFNKIITECHTMLDNVNTKEDILNLPLKRIQELVEWCRAEQSRQDQIFMEFRHLIPMGNLTPIQTSQLVKQFKEYGSFRSDIKTIARNLTAINYVPDLPSKSSYKLSILSDITLTSEVRCGKEAYTVLDENSDTITTVQGVIEQVSIGGNPIVNVDPQEVDLGEDPKKKLKFQETGNSYILDYPVEKAGFIASIFKQKIEPILSLESTTKKLRLKGAVTKKSILGRYKVCIIGDNLRRITVAKTSDPKAKFKEIFEIYKA